MEEYIAIKDMTIEERKQLFKINAMAYIGNGVLSKLVCDFISEKVPDYFFKISASSSGKYHPNFASGDAGLIRHTLMVAEVAAELIRMNDFYIGDCDEDILFSAIFLHDTFKNGEVDCGHTSIVHAELAEKEFLEFALKHKLYMGISSEETQKTIYDGIIEVSSAIGSHMGQWGTLQPTTNIEKVVHLSDYIASRKFFDLLEKGRDF